MPSDLMVQFNKFKKQGLNDEQAMKKAMDATASRRAKIRAADKEKSKKLGWVDKLKMATTKHLSKKYHSKAGRRYLESKGK